MRDRKWNFDYDRSLPGARSRISFSGRVTICVIILIKYTHFHGFEVRETLVEVRRFNARARKRVVFRNVASERAKRNVARIIYEITGDYEKANLIPSGSLPKTDHCVARICVASMTYHPCLLKNLENIVLAKFK